MRRRARALLLAVTVTARVLDTQRAVSLPVDSERQRVVTVDASARAVKRALRRYDARSHEYCGAVVAKAHRRHERNQDGLGAQVLRADQLAPLLLAHALTGLRIACRPHEWDFGDAYGEEGAMAIFGCGRDDRGGMAGVGVFAASAALDRLLGVDEKDEAPLGPSWVQRVFSRFQPNAPAPAPSRAVVNPRISVERRDAFLAAVPLLKHLQQGEANASFACADFDVYCVKVSAAWSKNVSLTSVAGAHSFQLARKVLRPQFDLVKAARPRPSFFGVLFCCRSFASSVPCRSLWCRRRTSPSRLSCPSPRVWEHCSTWARASTTKCNGSSCGTGARCADAFAFPMKVQSGPSVLKKTMYRSRACSTGGLRPGRCERARSPRSFVIYNLRILIASD